MPYTRETDDDDWTGTINVRGESYPLTIRACYEADELDAIAARAQEFLEAQWQQILDRLVAGDVRRQRLTVPEGFSLREIAARLETEGIGRAETFLQLTHDPDFIASLGITSPSLEGYLFPDTYLFDSGTPEERIIRARSRLPGAPVRRLGAGGPALRARRRPRGDRPQRRRARTIRRRPSRNDAAVPLLRGRAAGLRKCPQPDQPHDGKEGDGSIQGRQEKR